MREHLDCREFTLAGSQYARWRGTARQSPEDVGEQRETFQEMPLPGWHPLNVIDEVLLTEGYSFTSRIDQLKTTEGGNTVYRLSDLRRCSRS